MRSPTSQSSLQIIRADANDLRLIVGVSGMKRETMHYRARISRSCLVVVTLFILAGCAYFVSWEESVSGGVGRPIVDIQKTWGAPDEIRDLGNGDKEYKYWLKKLDKSCIHYWIVGSDEIIKGYSYEGRCRPIG